MVQPKTPTPLQKTQSRELSRQTTRCGEMRDFFQKYLGELLTAVIGGFAGWFFQRRMKRAAVHAAQADNQQKIMDLYQEALDDLEARYEKRLAFLKRECDERFQSLQAEIKALKQNLERWKQKYRTLRRAVEDDKAKQP